MKKLLTFLTLLTLFFGVGWAGSVTLDMKNGKLGTSNFSPQSGSARGATATNSNITVAFGGSQTVNTNTSNAYIGWNNNTTLTVTHATYNITKVVLNYQSQTTRGTITASTGTLNHDATVMTWTVGSTATKTVTITRASSGNQIKLTSIEVTFDDGGSQQTSHNITYAEVTGGSFSGPANAAEGAEVTIQATPENGYKLNTVTVTPTTSGVATPEVTISGNTATFQMPASDVTVDATFAPITYVQYKLVEKASDLVAGAEYIIAGRYTSSNSYTALLGAINSNIGSSITTGFSYIDTDKIINVEENCEVTPLTLGGTEDAWTFYNGSAYLAYIHTSTSGDNYLNTVNSIGTNNVAKWTINTENIPSSNALIINNFNNNRKLQFNSDRFCCYTGSQSPIALFKKVETGAYTVDCADGIEHGTISASPSTADAGKTITVTATPDAGYKLSTVTVTPESGSAPEVTISGNSATFEMPASNVTVSATFALAKNKVAYTIAPANSGEVWLQNGATYDESLGYSYSTMGTTVSIALAAYAGYDVNSLTITDGNGANVTYNTYNTEWVDGKKVTYYTFVMPATQVNIAATFKSGDIYILGTANDNPWNGNKGVKMTFDASTNTYSANVYFATTTDTGKGQFSFASNLSGNDGDENGNGSWNNIGKRWGAQSQDYDLVEHSAGATWTENNSDPNRFAVPYGVYEIKVNWGTGLVTATKKDITVTLDKAAGQLETGTTVNVVSNLSTLLQGCKSGVSATLAYSTDDGANYTDGNSFVVNSNMTAKGKAYYGKIEAESDAYAYTVVTHYAISCSANPTKGGSVKAYIGEDQVTSAIAGDLITLDVTTKSGYEISSVTLNGNVLEAVNGTYSFTMPNADANVVANFVAKDLVLTIVNDNNKGQVRGIPSTSTVGTKISFTVTPYPGYTVSSVTYSFTPTGGSENTQTLTTPYEFNMPGYDVTVTVTYSEQQSSGGDATDLYHESFGDNPNSARDWDDSYSVKTGVAEVYNGIEGYTVSNVKQGKNTTGHVLSGLNQSSTDSPASIIIGPLNVENYTDLVLSYYWKAGSIKQTYNTSLSYATSSTGTYTEVTGTGDGATTFVERTYNLPAAAQVSTLYLKIDFFTSNVQAIIDEINLSGVPSGVMDPVFSPAAGVYGVDIDVTISCSTPDATIYYTTDGTNPTTSSTQYTGEILVSESTTFKAIAVKDGLISEIVTTAYTISKSTETQTVTLNYNEPFTGQDGIGKFTVDNESGFAPVWTLDGSYGMKATSYSNGTNHAATSRLISPYIDMSNAVQPEMSFSHQINSYFTDVENQCTVWIREITNGTPGSWVNIPITFSNVYYQSGNWTNDFFEIDLSNYANKTIQISFLYTNPTEGSGAGTWEIQNFVVADNADYILVNNIAEFLALEDGTKAKFKNPVTVLYDYAQNSSSTYQEYIWFKDASGYCQFYLRPTLNSTYDEDTETYTYSTRAKYENGDIIPAGFVVTKNYYENGGFNQAASYDALNAGFLRSEEKGLADPEFISLDDLDQLNANDAADLARWCNHYVTVEKIRILVKDTNFGNNHNNKAFGFCDADDQNATQCSTWGYNKYSDEGSLKKDGTSAVVEVPEPSSTTFYNMKAILQIYKSGGTNYWELMPIEFTEWKEEEMTLRTLCVEGVKNNSYRISNNLLGVYSYYDEDLDADILWVKDDNGQSIHMVSPEAPYTDNFAIEFEDLLDNNDNVVIPANTRLEQQYYDQSNWCQLILTGKNGSNFVNKIINGGAIHGKYTDETNPTLTGVSLTSDDIYSASSYAPNYYVPASFVGSQSCNTDMYSEEGHGDFFFMTPKPQEYATIVWAVWDGQKMNMPTKQQGNSHNLFGEFSIDLSMNQNHVTAIPTGAYSFHAIIRKVSTSGAPALKGQGGIQNNQSANYMVYPLDIDPDNNPSTAINTVEVGNGEVKSIKYVNVAGIVSDHPFQGVNIVVTEYTDGTRTTTKMLHK